VSKRRLHNVKGFVVALAMMAACGGEGIRDTTMPEEPEQTSAPSTTVLPTTQPPTRAVAESIEDRLASVQARECAPGGRCR
jgi:hypothetical protein